LHEEGLEFAWFCRRNRASSACFPFPDLFSNELESWNPETLDDARNCTSEMMIPAQDESEPRSWTWQFSKTKMCKFNLVGMCMKGSQCPFAHQKGELRALPDLTCTKLCKTLIQTGTCDDAKCTYAHSKDELRATSTFHKTKLCRFSQMGHCALGSKCNFAHSDEELRPLDTTSLPQPPSPSSPTPEESLRRSEFQAAPRVPKAQAAAPAAQQAKPVQAPRKPQMQQIVLQQQQQQQLQHQQHQLHQQQLQQQLQLQQQQLQQQQQEILEHQQQNKMLTLALQQQLALASTTFGSFGLLKGLQPFQVATPVSDDFVDVPLATHSPPDVPEDAKVAPPKRRGGRRGKGRSLSKGEFGDFSLEVEEF